MGLGRPPWTNSFLPSFDLAGPAWRDQGWLLSEGADLAMSVRVCACVCAPVVLVNACSCVRGFGFWFCFCRVQGEGGPVFRGGTAIESSSLGA